MNVISFIGNIGRDAETRFTPAGKSITSFSVALSSGYGDNKLTTWLNCSIFGERGEKLASYITKGSQIGVTGEFSARTYTTKDGVEKLSLDVAVSNVTLLGGKGTQADSAEPKASVKSEQKNSEQDFDDSIPF